MAAVYGITGEVTSWTNNSRLISSGSQPSAFTANIVGDAVDSTAFDATNSNEFVPGLKSISGTITTLYDAPIIGAAGGVGWATVAYYVTNIQSWLLRMSRATTDTTEFNTGAVPDWRSFTPGLINWSGEYSGFLDGTTAVTAPADYDGGLGTVTLTIASGVTFAGSAHLTNLDSTVSPAATNNVRHGFQGSGNLTAAGDKFFDAAVVSIITDPSSDTLTLKAFEAGVTDRTFSGAAFWESVEIRCAVDQIPVATINWRGTGAWTIT